MKKILLFLLAIVAFASCKQNKFEINGEILGNTIPAKVYLKLVTDNGEPKIIDSSFVKNGVFKMTGTSDYPEFCMLQFSNDMIFPIVLENGNIQFNINLENVSNYKIGGSLSNDLLNDYRNAEKKFFVGIEALTQEYVNAQSKGTLTPELDSSLNAKYKVITAKRNQYVIDFIKKHSTNFAAAVVLSEQESSLPIQDFKALYDDISKNFPNSQLVKKLQKYIEVENRTAVGSPFIDFDLANVDGKMVKFSSIVDKYKVVLLDFWAAWCGPCRLENPNVLKLYNDFKNKGFEVVGVSLDDSRSQWLNAIAKDGITWIQLSDLKGWKSSAAQLYGVNAIPSTFLIYNGKIVAKNLRGEELDKKVAELINKKTSGF